MKEYTLERMADDEGLINLWFNDEIKPSMYLISDHEDVNKNVLGMLKKGVKLLIEGEFGDDLNDLYKGINSMYIKTENESVLLYSNKDAENKKAIEQNYSESADSLLS